MIPANVANESIQFSCTSYNHTIEKCAVKRFCFSESRHNTLALPM